MSKKLKSCLIIAFLSIPFLGFSHDRVVRAAIDIGSGATKLKVAEVNVKTQKIEKVLASESFTVQYQEELEKSPDGTFNEEVMQTGLDALKKSQEIAKKYKAEKVVAVATAAFRKAANVEEYIDRIHRETDVDVHIIDQNLEGILGFEATAAKLKAHPKNIVVWDIGGGSYQFTTLDEKNELLVYRGTDASIPFKNHVIKHIKKEDPNTINTPNPLTLVELKCAECHAQNISKQVDELFQKKIKDPKTKVVGIGNIFSYRIQPLVNKKSTFTSKELLNKVLDLEGKTDKDLGESDYVNVAVTNPVLVLGFMQSLGIKKMDIVDINNADGALLYSAFWQKATA